jgi:hypothetical protein
MLCGAWRGQSIGKERDVREEEKGGDEGERGLASQFYVYCA